MMEAEITPDDIAARNEQARWQDDGGAQAASGQHHAPSALDRLISFGATSTWMTIGWVAVFVAAFALRFMRLDRSALDVAEAMRAYDAWALFRGLPLAGGEAISNVGPLLLLLEGFAFFLFGTTDVTARFMPALIGFALVLLPLALRRWVGAPAALGMAALAALSPTLVQASRVVSPEIVIAALALAAVACLIRLGERDEPIGGDARGPAIALGIVTGAAYAAGPSAVTVALTLIVGLGVASLAEPAGAIRRGLSTLRGRSALPAFLLAAIATSALCFTRFLSEPSGIVGAGETLAVWWQLLAGPGSGQPVPLFLLILLVYEPIAVAFAIVALARDRVARGDAVALFMGWTLAAFLIWSFSAGRGPEHAIHVVLPLILLAGIGIGNAFHAVDWRSVWQGNNGVLALAMLGFVIALGAVGVLLMRVGNQGMTAAVPPVAVLCLVVVPLAYLIWRLSDDDAPEQSGGLHQPMAVALFVLALLLGSFALRSATLLAFYRGDAGTELLAQRTGTLGTLPSIERFLRLARDAGVADGSTRDPTGSHGLSIAVESDVQWPYAWYFREFPDLSVVERGAAATAGAQVAIASIDAGLAGGGYTVESWPWLTTVPPQYQSPDIAGIAGALVNPTRWIDGWRYLLFRDGVPAPPAAMVAVGLAPEVAGRIQPPTGPFNLTDRPGSGTEPGQFKDPIGLAVSADGIIAVVDSGNARVQRFTADGTFLDIWGDDLGVTFTRTENGLGPTGITIAPDGLTWVADTWGHRVVAIDGDGQMIQSIGAETVDTGDDATRVDQDGGRFFGPRAVAVNDDAIYVSDTGNERIQKFTRDGAFIAAWGGYGSEPEQLIEPVGIAIGPDGNLYVADSGNARISIFTPEGEPVAQWPVADWPPPLPGGIPPGYQPYLAFDAAGSLYATASNVGQGLMIDRSGSVTGRITQAGSERLAQPIGVAISPDGDVLFSDIGRDTVLTYTPPEPLPAATPD